VWKRSVGLNRYAVGGAMEIGESGSSSGWLEGREIGRPEGSEQKAKAM
jgi:hypothetical protein